jgi:hypothetical protein
VSESEVASLRVAFIEITIGNYQTQGARMGGLVTSAIRPDRMVESPQYSRIRESNHYMETSRDYRQLRRTPDMWSELFAGALAMIAVVGLMFLVLSYI